MAKPAKPKGPARSCGECTACCTIMAVTELSKLMWVSCEHLSKTGPGCGIYTTRPHTCRGFACAWLQGSFGPGDRPDKIGVMLARPPASLMGGPAVYLWEVRPGASATGRGSELLAQVRAHGYRVTVYTPEKAIVKEPIRLTIGGMPPRRPII